jgi:hypothetical protein
MPIASMRQASRVILLCSLAAASFAAAAQIHRCKDENGQTVISDRPCTADNSAQEARRAPAGSAVDRIAAPQMASARARELAARYDFIPERAGQPAVRGGQGAK